MTHLSHASRTLLIGLATVASAVVVPAATAGAATTFQITEPTGPVNAGQVTVGWTAVSDAESYTVDVDGSPVTTVPRGRTTAAVQLAQGQHQLTVTATRSGVLPGGSTSYLGPGAHNFGTPASITPGAIGIGTAPALPKAGSSSEIRIAKYATASDATADFALVRGTAVVAEVTGIDLPAAAGVYAVNFTDPSTGQPASLSFQAGDELAIVNESSFPLPVVGDAGSGFSEQECSPPAALGGDVSGCTIASDGYALQVDLAMATDSDGDGVPDSTDQCPYDPSASVAANCPDLTTAPVTVQVNPPGPAVSDCASGIAAQGARTPTRSKVPTALSGHDLAFDSHNHLRGVFLASISDHLVVQTARGAFSYAAHATDARYALDGNRDVIAWSELHDVTLPNGSLIHCEALYATPTPGGAAVPVAASGAPSAYTHLDVAADGHGKVALAATASANIDDNLQATYRAFGTRNGHAVQLGKVQTLPMRGVEIVRVAARNGRAAVAEAGFGHLAVYAGPVAGPLRLVYRAQKVDADSLDVALDRHGQPVVAYSRGYTLHLLHGRRDSNTRYPAYGAGMSLSPSGTVAHLAWSVKPTAAPCEAHHVIYNCAGQNGLLVGNAVVGGGAMRVRHVRLADKFADAVAPQVLVSPKGGAIAVYLRSDSRRLKAVRVP